ncbi:MAG TPA: hypothetical protein VMF06_01485 [Candidatus Limnocylindria bacterium]|nr:hypothetical protein [Candidatus Limnocylindria bacterium]
MSSESPSPSSSPTPPPSSSNRTRARRVRRSSGRSFTAWVFRTDKWFVRFGIAGFVLLLAMGLFVAKLWIVTPTWFKTKIKISGLDYLQAAALRHTAQNEAKAGRLNESVAAWRRAIGNNRGDLELYRGYLQTLVNSPQVRREHVGAAIGEGYTLLALSRTNVLDVELICSYLRRLDLFSSESILLGQQLTNLTPTGIRLYAEVLFFTDNSAGFAKYWDQHQDTLTNDPSARLIHAAWGAFWGPPGGFSESRAELLAARNDPKLAVLASKLQLRVSRAIPDLVNYKAALDQLVELHSDRVIDHATYWQLLMEAGRKGEAADLARRFSNPPASAEEAIRLVSALDALGMGDYALEVVNRQIAESNGELQLWIAKAELLNKQKRWKELQEMAVAMRNDRRLGKRVLGYAHYLEGLAAQNQNNTEAAKASFERSLEEIFPSPVLAFRAGTTLRSLGYPKLSADLMQRNETTFSNRVDFWFQLARAAYEDRDAELLERATQRVYELAPNNVLAVNNYAAALLANRSKPDEAVSLTMAVLAEYPDKVDANVNHALALILNRRYADAAKLLSRFSPERLDSVALTSYHYGWFEIHAQQNEIAQAKTNAALIDRQLLLSPQTKFVDETLKKWAPKREE